MIHILKDGRKIKIIIMLVTIIIISTSAYTLGNFFANNNNLKDNIPPKIPFITGNTTGTIGKLVNILVFFSDNIEVTEAILYFKKASDIGWRNISIINYSANIQIPLNSKEDFYYYATVNDAANNGPVGIPSNDGSKYYTITVLNNSNNNEEISKKVFIEDGTASWCSNCPAVSDFLDDLYNPDNPDFYYVTMVHDKNDKAKESLENNYNIFGFPSVFIDGGYEVVYGLKEEYTYANSITRSFSRERPKLYLNLDAFWNKSSEELKTIVTIQNNEATLYKGYLKVYITEINSRWSDWDGHPYHYGFLDYAINKPVEIEINSEETYSEVWKVGTSGYSNIYPENLFVIAVIFSSDSIQKFSDSPTNKYPFDAHYTDAVSATRVLEGDLPPSVGICWPKEGRYCLLGFCNQKLHTLNGKTLLLGRTFIKVCIDAGISIEKVEIFIEGRFNSVQTTLYEEPFEWVWKNFAFGRYTISVKIYDIKGRTAIDSMDVIAFIL